MVADAEACFVQRGWFSGGEFVSGNSLGAGRSPSPRRCCPGVVSDLVWNDGLKWGPPIGRGLSTMTTALSYVFCLTSIRLSFSIKISLTPLTPLVGSRRSSNRKKPQAWRPSSANPAPCALSSARRRPPRCARCPPAPMPTTSRPAAA